MHKPVIAADEEVPDVLRPAMVVVRVAIVFSNAVIRSLAADKSVEFAFSSTLRLNSVS